MLLNKIGLYLVLVKNVLMTYLILETKVDLTDKNRRCLRSAGVNMLCNLVIDFSPHENKNKSRR